MLKKKRSVILLFLSIFFLIDAAGTVAALRSYPQFSIGRSALFGENNRNLKEFQTDDEGVITSLSDDPWINYAFGEPTNVRNISVKVSRMAGPETDAQFYLMPSLGYQSKRLTDGWVSVCFGRFQGRKGVGGIRLDMATEKGASLLVEEAVVNRRMAVILDVQRELAVLLGLGFFVLAEIWGWYRLMRNRGEKRSAMGLLLTLAGIQGGGKLALLWVLKDQLTGADQTGQQFLLCWMLVLGLESLCILTLHLGAGSKRTDIWYSCGLAVPFSFTAFSMAELLNLTAFDFRTPEYLLLNLVFCALVPAVLLLLLRRGAFAFTISSVIFTVWAVANHYYGILRDNPLEYFDMANAKTAVNVVGNYTFEADRQVVSAVLVMVVIGIVMFAALGVKSCGWHTKTVAGNFAVVFAALVFFIAKIPVFGNFSNLQIISSEKGYLLSFASFIKMGQVKRPDGYTGAAADRILEAKEERDRRAEESSAPNIIVIMDEAFADLPKLYGFKTVTDALPNIHAMKENTIHGRLLVSVYGGGTANTEYEFLTGNSLLFFPVGCSPYVQYVSSRQQSLAWKLRNLGYSTAGYHPYLAISYRRTAAYPLLGLDPFYSIEEELPYEECVRSYVSDRSDFKNVIHLYENRDPGQPFFLFNVTMQNHGGYSSEVPAVEVTVKPEDERLESAPLLEYLALIHETDAAFQELVDYFSGVEEETIILMFGDHQPSMSGEVNAALDQMETEQGKELDSQRRYYSTFVMWANFDIDEASDVVSSPNYLRSILLEQAGVKLNAYESFLLELGKEYPALNSFGYLDRRGEWHSRGEQTAEELEEYQYLVYQNVFDKKNLRSEHYE